MSLLVLAALVLGVSWTGAHYFGPSLFRASNGPDCKTSQSSSNQTLSATGEMANVLVDFGNGTRIWFNTTVPHDWNYYNITDKITEGDMSSRWFGGTICAHFIYKILGFGCSPGQIGCSGYWSLWVWNETGSCWDYSIEGVDLLNLSTVRKVAWHFYHYDGSNPFEGPCS